MKKLILSMTLLAAIAFSCSDDEGGSSNDCQSCESELFGISYSTEICDNGDGTADITVTAAGQSSTETIDLEGESISDLNCDQFNSIDFSLE